MNDLEWWGNSSHTEMFDKYVERITLIYGPTDEELYEMASDQFWWLIDMGWTDYNSSLAIKEFPVLQGLLKELQTYDANEYGDKYEIRHRRIF